MRGQEFHEKDGKAYCAEHYWQRFGKRCAIGGEILKGEYVANGWGETYCKEHAAGLPLCSSCDRPICEALTGGGRRYGDGRTVCHRCRRTAVDDGAAGQGILDEVRRALAQAGLHIGTGQTPLRLVDQKELARRSTKPYAKAPAGMAWHEELSRGGEVIQRQVKAILILHGLPREHFAAIAAHELGHSFLFMNSFPDLEPKVEEGVCELAKYAWLKQQGTREATYRLEQMERSEDPVYGEGFRAARRGLERMGMAGLLAYVREHKRFP